MKYIPRQDFVVLEMDEMEDRSDGRYLLPQSDKQAHVPAVVLAIGPGDHNDDDEPLPVHDLQEGDRVMFNRFSAIQLNEQDRLFLVRQSEIGCKIDD